jgi:hypothetical protein
VRQEREFDWPGVIVRVREEILRLAAERRGGAHATDP